MQTFGKQIWRESCEVVGWLGVVGGGGGHGMGWRGNELAQWAAWAGLALPCGLGALAGRHHNLLLIIINCKFSSQRERLRSSVG